MSEKHDHGETGASSLLAIELRHHMPFTALGAASGIAIMLAFVLLEVPRGPSEVLFEILHPAHVLLSAIVTTALYRRYRRSLPAAVLVGFVGAVGVGTLSDIVFPYLGGLVVGAHMGHIHLAFLEEWWLVNPAALAGVAIGAWRKKTRLPHSGHVFVSTWASLFYLTSYGDANWLPLLPVIFVLLFVAVWTPCCFGDIVFPLLIAGKKAAMEHEHQH
ncbi:MAG TPA: hypothetical protein PLE19_13580 [Planctomycetota bacterium]|nr:hypothetical protein [Planctomycetota bacterium]HRR80846.1 hypothetical protein [Planctomycetota bacterium]HRT95965.1 hypothetical protein [Planctomycetota bacterium]